MSAEITAAGVYDMTDAEYHADPVPGGSLSSSGARRLLPPSCPALFRHERDNPPEPTHAFDIGHAAHTLVLGTGAEFAVIEAEDWRTKAAREARKEAHEAGKTPLLTSEHDQVQAMAAALRQHPIASALLDPNRGRAEQSLFWQDEPTGIWRRARIDFLPYTNTVGRLLVADYKTTNSASPSEIARHVANYGYHQQADYYLDGIAALGLGVDPVFLFVFQEKTAPYLVTVVELDQTALEIGHHLNRQAINTYVRCMETGHWPSYSEDVELISLPYYIENRYLQEIA